MRETGLILGDTVMLWRAGVIEEGKGVRGKEREVEDALEGVLGPPHQGWV